MKCQHYISWWNVENLFDVYDSPERPEWLQKSLNSELKGWDQQVLTKKLSNLTSIIRQMNSGKGPDILGVCEVENKTVLEKLIQTIQLPERNYDIIHHDMKDNRGIDIAFIYDKNEYTFDGDPSDPECTTFFSHEIIKRNATRDIVQVELKTRKGNSLILVGNHWPARSAGKYLSEPYRMIAGETLSYFIERIHDLRGDDMPVIVMGDFNDTPYDRALTEYALSCNSKQKVVYGKNPFLYNLMWPLMSEGIASYYFGSDPLMIDQILVNKAIARQNQTFSLKENTAKIESFKEMRSGRYKKPKRFGRPSSKKSFNDTGFSDHYPVTILLYEK